MTIFHILIAVFRVTVPLTPKIQRIFPSSLDRSITLILVQNLGINLEDKEIAMKVVVVGGGWSRCAAALSVHKQGVEVILIERTDMLLGTGLVGGIFLMPRLWGAILTSCLWRGPAPVSSSSLGPTSCSLLHNLLA